MSWRRRNSAVFLALLVVIATAGLLTPRVTAQPGEAERLREGISWQQGEWWVIEQEQQGVWMKSDTPPWVYAGKLRFIVEGIEHLDDRQVVNLTVLDLDRPADGSKTWDVQLTYDSLSLRLVSGHYRVGQADAPMPRGARYLPLGSGGLDATAIHLPRMRTEPARGTEDSVAVRIDVRSGDERLFHRIDIPIPDEVRRAMRDAEEYQLWLPGEPWWRYYERSHGLPVRARMVDCSRWHSN